jgi:hypothetical protein
MDEALHWFLFPEMSLWGPKIQTGGDLKTNNQEEFKNECSKASRSANLADTRFRIGSKTFELCRFYTNIQNSRIICGFFLDFGRFNSGFTNLIPFHNTHEMHLGLCKDLFL